MNTNLPVTGDCQDEVADLLPWFASGVLKAEERERVQAHLNECAACRAELELDRQFAATMQGKAVSAESADAAFAKIAGKLTPQSERGVPSEPVRIRVQRPNISRRQRTRPSYFAVAAIVMLSVLGYLWLQVDKLSAPTFSTAGLPSEKGVEGADLRVIFDKSISEHAAKEIIANAGAELLARPGNEGEVYFVRVANSADSTKDRRSVQDSLRQSQGVIFVEPVVVGK